MPSATPSGSLCAQAIAIATPIRRPSQRSPMPKVQHRRRPVTGPGQGQDRTCYHVCPGDPRTGLGVILRWGMRRCMKEQSSIDLRPQEATAGRYSMLFIAPTITSRRSFPALDSREPVRRRPKRCDPCLRGFRGRIPTSTHEHIGGPKSSGCVEFVGSLPWTPLRKEWYPGWL